MNDNNIADLALALTKALGELSDIRKGKEAKVQMKSGGSYGYKYADLADVLQTIRQVLSSNGLAVLQSPVSHDNDTISIYTIIVHSSGQQMTFGPLTLPAGRTAQETGSAITYARRYALLACLGLAAEDDDGASAAPRKARAPQPPQKAPEARTPEEAEIRTILAGLSASTAKEIKGAFIDQYGKLADLATSEHKDALEWVKVAVQFADEQDAQWVTDAKGEQS
jgi:hypothetical protein